MAKKSSSRSKPKKAAEKSTDKSLPSEKKLASLVRRLWPPTLIEMEEADEITQLILRSDPDNPVALLMRSQVVETVDEQVALLEESVREFEARRGSKLPGLSADDSSAAMISARSRLADIKRDMGLLHDAIQLYERNCIDVPNGMDSIELAASYIGLRNAEQARKALTGEPAAKGDQAPAAAQGLLALVDLWQSPDSPETATRLSQFVRSKGQYVSVLLGPAPTDATPIDLLVDDSPENIPTNADELLDAMMIPATISSCWKVWRSAPEAICRLRDEWLRQNPVPPPDPDTPQLDELLRKARRVKQKADSVWLLDIQQPETWMQAAGRVHQAWQVIVFELSTKQVVAQKLGIQEPTADDLTSTLAAGMCGFFVEQKTRPGLVRCRNAVVASRIEAGMKPLGVAVEASDDFGLLETYLQPTLGMWRGTPEWSAVSETPDVTDAELAAFYAAADQFLSVYRAVPLRKRLDIENLRIAGERGGKPLSFVLQLPEGLFFPLAFEFLSEDEVGTVLSVSYGEAHTTRFVDWKYRVETHRELKPPFRDGFVTLNRFDDEEARNLTRTDILHTTSLLEQATVAVKKRQQQHVG